MVSSSYSKYYSFVSLKENACKENKAFGAKIVFNVQVVFCWQYPLCHGLAMLV